MHIQIYAKKLYKLLFLWFSIHAFPHFFLGVGFESALDPERPFSVLSIPDEVTRHSLLQWCRRKRKDKVKTVDTRQLKQTFQASII